MVLGIGSIGRVWTNENRISSDGNTLEAILYGLPENALELFGELTSINGVTKLGGVFAQNPFQEGKEVTTDGFDQVQLFYSINSIQQKLMMLGFDVKGMIAKKHGGKHHPIAANPNAVPDLNAWYSPQSDDLTFGTNGDPTKGEDKWHLASDGDVAVHEAGHLLLDHINSTLGSWISDCRNYGTCHPDDLEPLPDNSWRNEGRSIHEGFGDAIAALLYDDAEMSEDFGPNIGKPPSKEDGLRLLNNDLTLDDVGWEEHDRGQVYSGFFWSIKKALADPSGEFKLDSRAAADLTMMILVNHASNYDTSRPQSKDFIKAVLMGTDAMQAAGLIPVDFVKLKELIFAEGKRRKMLKEFEPQDPNTPPSLPDPDTSVSSFEELKRLAGNRARFIPKQASQFYGGSQEIYGQQFKSARFGYIDVVGGGVFVNRQQDGSIANISAKDVRILKSGDIDETVNLDPGKAFHLAGMAAQKELVKAGANLRNFRFSPTDSRKRDVLKRLKEAQMDARVADTAMRYFDPRFKLMQESPKMVILPGSNNLHYEIKVGLGIFHVNAKSGEVKFVRDVIVN